MYNAGYFSLSHDMYRHGYAKRAGIVSSPRYRMSPMQLARRVAPVLASAAYKAYSGYKSKPRASSNVNTVSGRSRKAYTPKPKKSLKQQVKAIQKELKSNTAQLIYKKAYTSREVTTTRSQTCSNYEGFAMAQFEIVLAELRFFNPATPGTLTQASGATGTYDRSYHFKNVYSKFTAVNNYQVPVKVKIYVVTPKEDTSIGPHTAFTNGLSDVGAPTSTSPLLDLTDSPEFCKLWTIKGSIKKVLQPGQVCKLVHSVKDVQYDPAIFDSHTLAYQNKFKNYAFVVRVTGVLAHDTAVTTEFGLGPAGVDIYHMCKAVVEYDAGIDLKYIVLNDTTASAFTNAAVVSEKPVADNISYSIS